MTAGQPSAHLPRQREPGQQARRVLVVTGEPLGATMAGPAIRATEMARHLAREHEVTLATLAGGRTDIAGVRVVAATGRMLRRLADQTEVVILQGAVLRIHPWLRDTDAVVVADVYDPFHLETLEQEKNRPTTERSARAADAVQTLNEQLRRADFLVCASEKQRDFWLGQLAGLDRINPSTYDADPRLRSLIDVVPFGLPDQPPTQRRPGLRGVLPGVGVADKVVLWGGGVYNWFDPLTLVRAIDRVRHEVPDVRLVFMGMKHPNPDVPEMAMGGRVRQLAGQLALTGVHVFFNESWVPYADRADVLLDADVGVSCHFDQVETQFSFRTRILDYLWAGLPIVCTGGDAFGDLVQERQLGAVVPPQDVDALSRALIGLLSDEGRRDATSARVRAVAAEFTWSSAMAPLAQFVRNPIRAADAGAGAAGAEATGAGAAGAGAADAGAPQGDQGPVSAPGVRSVDLRRDLRLVRRYVRQGGLGELVTRVTGRIRRVLRERVLRERVLRERRPGRGGPGGERGRPR